MASDGLIHLDPNDVPLLLARHAIVTARNEVGQGYVFTGVCDSVHRGGLPQCMLGYHPHPLGAGTPPEQAPPLPEQTPPRPEHAGRYGQRAGGTHPTGMQSC